MNCEFLTTRGLPAQREIKRLETEFYSVASEFLHQTKRRNKFERINKVCRTITI